MGILGTVFPARRGDLMKTQEDEDFERMMKAPDFYRNHVIEEIAQQLEKVRHNTSEYYAEFVRKLKREKHEIGN